MGPEKELLRAVTKRTSIFPPAIVETWRLGSGSFCTSAEGAVGASREPRRAPFSHAAHYDSGNAAAEFPLGRDRFVAPPSEPGRPPLAPATHDDTFPTHPHHSPTVRKLVPAPSAQRPGVQ